jgi:hypothetical protein
VPVTRFVGWRAAKFAVAMVAALVVAVWLSPAPPPFHAGGSGRHLVDEDERSAATADDGAGRPRPGARPSDAATAVADAGSAAAATGPLRASRGDVRANLRPGSAQREGPPGPAFKALAGWPGFAEAELEFDGETRDTQWAAATEGRLLSLVSELDGVALNRLEADCRESMCRLLLLHPPEVEPVYSIRQIYDRAGELGLGPVAADTKVEAGEPSGLRVFLRRREAASSRR